LGLWGKTNCFHIQGVMMKEIVIKGYRHIKKLEEALRAAGIEIYGVSAFGRGEEARTIIHLKREYAEDEIRKIAEVIEDLSMLSSEEKLKRLVG